MEESRSKAYEDRMACSVHLDEAETGVVIIDQRELPNRQVYRTLHTDQELYDAIKTLAVRGAPAIGICAGYGMYVLSLSAKATESEAFLEEMRRCGDYLVSSRPTAVNLSWAVKRMLGVIERSPDEPVDAIRRKLHDESIAIHDEDIAMCTRSFRVRTDAGEAGGRHPDTLQCRAAGDLQVRDLDRTGAAGEGARHRLQGVRG